MKLSRKTWDRYRRAHTAVQVRAAQEAMAYFDTLPWETDRRTALALMQAKVVRLVDEYGLADGELSAMFYDELMDMFGVSLPAANIADAMPASLVVQDVDDAMARSVTQETARQAVGAVVSKFVKRRGLETSRNNAARDGAMWSWVCIGDSCAFCRTLASQGWVNASRAVQKGMHATHVHGNCDCQFVVKPRSEALEIEGYDYRKFEREYDAADGKTAKDKMNAMRRSDYTEQYADERNARRRELYRMEKEQADS